MKVSALLGILILAACESPTEDNITWTLNKPDSLIYQLSLDHCLLEVRQQKFMVDKPKSLKVFIYSPDKQNLLTDARLSIMIINKGRRQPLAGLSLVDPGIYAGTYEAKFQGRTTMEFEIKSPSFRDTESIDLQIQDN